MDAERLRHSWSAEASSYGGHDRRGRQVTRAHLIPPDGTFPDRGVPSAACGQPWLARKRSKATIQVLDMAQPLPEGLTWCPGCLGVAAEQMGLRDRVAELVLPALR